MANKRKRHLRYQVKKGRAVPAKLKGDASTKKAAANPLGAKVEKDSIDSGSRRVYSKLSNRETRFIRNELIYTAIIATLVLVIYGIIVALFRYTQVDEWLTSLIKLG